VPLTRTLLPAELPALRDLLLRLGREDRALRFGAAVDDAAIEAHCRRLGQAGLGAQVIGAFEDGRLIAVAELWFSAAPPPRSCEVAIAVDAPWRGRGIGGVLLGRAVLAARNRWADRLRLCCLPENRRMQRLARRFAHGLHVDEGSAEAEIRLPYPSWPSLWTEAMAEVAGSLASLSGSSVPCPPSE
jgi:RimJ/RimL family protein N-acetyltransferase